MKLSKAKGSSSMQPRTKGEETKRQGNETHSDEELDNSALIRKNNQI